MELLNFDETRVRLLLKSEKITFAEIPSIFSSLKFIQSNIDITQKICNSIFKVQTEYISIYCLGLDARNEFCNYAWFRCDLSPDSVGQAQDCLDIKVHVDSSFNYPKFAIAEKWVFGFRDVVGDDIGRHQAVIAAAGLKKTKIENLSSFFYLDQ